MYTLLNLSKLKEYIIIISKISYRLFALDLSFTGGMALKT